MNKYVKNFFTIAFVLMSVSLCNAEETWEDVNNRVTGLYQEQEFIKASKTAEYAVDFARKMGDGGKEKLAISLDNLAIISTHLGKFAESERLSNEALSLREEIFGKDSVESVNSWNHLAINYYMAKTFADAEVSLEKILEILEKTYGVESLQIVPALEKLSKFYKITENKKKEKEITARLAKIVPFELDPPVAENK